MVAGQLTSGNNPATSQPARCQFASGAAAAALSAKHAYICADMGGWGTICSVKTIAVVTLSISLLIAACSSNTAVAPIPSLDSSTSAELQARAFMRACRDVICAGAPIYAPDSTPDSVRMALLQYTDEVQYLTQPQIEQRYSPEGRFEDGATFIDVESVQSTERTDVQGVNVSTSRGRYDFVGRTYLFQWDGGVWVDASPDAVDVTVTSSVS